MSSDLYRGVRVQDSLGDWIGFALSQDYHQGHTSIVVLLEMCKSYVNFAQCDLSLMCAQSLNHNVHSFLSDSQSLVSVPSGSMSSVDLGYTNKRAEFTMAFIVYLVKSRFLGTRNSIQKHCQSNPKYLNLEIPFWVQWSGCVIHMKLNHQLIPFHSFLSSGLNYASPVTFLKNYYSCTWNPTAVQIVSLEILSSLVLFLIEPFLVQFHGAES